MDRITTVAAVMLPAQVAIPTRVNVPIFALCNLESRADVICHEIFRDLVSLKFQMLQKEAPFAARGFQISS